MYKSATCGYMGAEEMRVDSANSSNYRNHDTQIMHLGVSSGREEGDVGRASRVASCTAFSKSPTGFCLTVPRHTMFLGLQECCLPPSSWCLHSALGAALQLYSPWLLPAVTIVFCFPCPLGSLIFDTPTPLTRSRILSPPEQVAIRSLLHKNNHVIPRFESSPYARL